MNTAINRFTRDFIDAASPNAQFLSCICPGCGSTVYLAGGAHTFQRIHFRHLRLTADESCRFYHPGGDTIIAPNPRETVHRVRHPDLLFDLANGSSGAFWELLLLVPKYDGEYQFQLGHYSPLQHRYDCEEVPDGGRIFKVHPQSDSYSFRVFLKSGGEIDPPQVDGLGDCAVFLFGHEFARITPAGVALQWGQVVAVVSRESLEVASVSTLVDWRKLADRNGWHATILGLPAKPSNEVVAWVRRTLGRTVRPIQSELSILAPVSGGMLPDHTWAMHPGAKEATVAIRVPGTSRKTVDVWVQPEGGVAEQHLVVELHDGVGIAQIHFASGFSKVFADSGSAELGVLVAAGDPSRPRPKVAFVFESQKRLIPVSLWDISLTENLRLTRVGMQTLDDLRLPDRCNFNASLWEGRICLDRVEIILPNPDIDFGMESLRVAKKIQGWLREPEKRIEIDAGGFGRTAFPPVEFRSPVAIQIKTDKAVSARQQWFALAASAKGGGRHSLARPIIRSNIELNRLLVHSRYLRQ